MKKAGRILIGLACMITLILSIPAGAAPTERMQLKVVADKESAKAGDTVAFQIVMGPVSEIGSIQMTVDIPAGLSYVAESGKAPFLISMWQKEGTKFTEARLRNGIQALDTLVEEISLGGRQYDRLEEIIAILCA